jgi:predicted Fe-Mo cluster-binding NifX family protein
MRFYIVDTNDGEVRGTDSEEVANGFAQSEDFFVIDSKTDKWLVTADARHTIKSI